MSVSVDVQSLVWQGIPWHHRLGKTEPTGPAVDDLAILEVTGDDAGFPDERFALSLANKCDRPVFTLFNVPNQPIWDMREDDLISYSFAKFLETGDPSWPLSTVMAQSVISALSVLSSQGYNKVLVTGASKRGWATWIAATLGDPRIVGIAPRVYDCLPIEGQLKKQEADWGFFSPRLGDYSSRSLQAMTGTPRGQELLHQVDPYFSLGKINCPQLILNAANDDFWTTDAACLYADALPNARFHYTPNSGHTLPINSPWQDTLGAFADLCSASLPWPNLSFKGSTVTAEEACLFRLWTTHSDNRLYVQSNWRCLAENQSGVFDIPSIEEATTAYTIECLFPPGNGVRGYSLFTPIEIR